MRMAVSAFDSDIINSFIVKFLFYGFHCEDNYFHDYIQAYLSVSEKFG